MGKAEVQIVDKVKDEIPGKLKEKKLKKTRKPLGDDFVAPDGGWGWVILVAAGGVNLTLFPVFQSFGLIYRDRLSEAGINNLQISSIFNYNTAICFSIGIANGPMFKKMSFRQIALIGTVSCCIGLVLSLYANEFITYIFGFSIFYGAGMGMTTSATAIALNTYFKKKRRIAAGLSWTVTGLGPILVPQILILMMPVYGDHGTVLIFIGVALNAIMFSLLLQPVEWHVKRKASVDKENADLLVEENVRKQSVIDEILPSVKRTNSFITSQYVFNEDDPILRGYEIVEPGIPMLARGNDGYFTILHQPFQLSRSNSTLTEQNIENYNRNGSQALSISGRTENEKQYDIELKSMNKENKNDNALNPLLDNTNEGNDNSTSILKETSRKSSTRSLKHENDELIAGLRKISNMRKNSNSFKMESDLAKLQGDIRYDKIDLNAELNVNTEEEKEEKDDPKKKLTIFQKVYVFFDLDLLKDHVFVNIFVGLSTANFADWNFNLLVPFILGDMGFSLTQVGIFMSVLATFDLLVRFFIPFIASKIGLSNRTFYLIGVANLALGRVVICHFRSFKVMMCVAVWNGVNKGLRTVFMGLVVPSHVPINKLPGATGLQLFTAGILCFVVGPIIGQVNDSFGIVPTLYFLNSMTLAVTISWTVEHWYLKRKRAVAGEVD